MLHRIVAEWLIIHKYVDKLSSLSKDLDNKKRSTEYITSLKEKVEVS